MSTSSLERTRALPQARAGRVRSWFYKAAFLVRHTMTLVMVLLVVMGSYAWLFFRLRVLKSKLSKEKIDAIHRRNALRYRGAAEKLKGATIKIGQMLSTRVDLTPEPCVEVLRGLQDAVEPEPYAYVVAQIEGELEKPLEKLFASFEEEALAAASFGQVHKARTLGGDEVAVKVHHAHIRESLVVDLACFRVIAAVLDPIFPKLRIYQVYRESADALYTELDYVFEREAAERVRANFEDDPRVVVPRTYPDLSGKSVLTTEFIHGEKVNDLPVLEKHGIDSAEVIRLVIDAYTRQIYLHGFFQSDPHPGNLFLILPESEEEEFKIGIIDFGQSKEIPDKIRGNLRRAVLGTVMKDEDLLIEAMLDMKAIGEGDKPVMLEMIAYFSERIQTGSPEEWNNLDFKELTKKLWYFLDKVEELHIPDDLVLFGRTMGLLHGLSSELDSSVNVFEVAQPHLMKFLFSSK